MQKPSVRTNLIYLVLFGLFVIVLDVAMSGGRLDRGELPFTVWIIAIVASAGLPPSRRWRRVTGSALRDPLVVLLLLLAQFTLSGQFGADAATNPTLLWLWAVILVLAVAVRIGQGLLEDSPVSIFWKDPLEDSLDD